MLDMLTMPELLAATVLATIPAPQGADPTGDSPALRPRLEQALRRYFASQDARGPQLAAVVGLASDDPRLVTEILRSKSFLAKTDVIARRGVIDEHYRFRDDPAAENPALIHGPASGAGLAPLAVYVPDVVDSSRFERSLPRDGPERGWFVFLVPDERRDNKWHPGQHEHRRHTTPLRELLLRYPIDPDRVNFVGSGRGGHAAWDVGLMSAGRWAAIVPCNGGLVHEGGYATCYGVFLENAKSLAVFTVYNNTFDHGLDSCRYAVRMFEKWGYRCESAEEQRMRVMGLSEATQQLTDVQREAHPRMITKRFNRLADGGHYWLRALERPLEWDPGARIQVRGKWPEEQQAQREKVWAEVRRQCASLEGSIRGNRVNVVARGIKRLRVYFDPELIDFDRKVTVTVNGKRSRARAVRRKTDVVLELVHETGDTACLYWDFVDLAVPQNRRR